MMGGQLIPMLGTIAVSGIMLGGARLFAFKRVDEQWRRRYGHGLVEEHRIYDSSKAVEAIARHFAERR